MKIGSFVSLKTAPLLWLAGQLLPESPELTYYLRSAKSSLFAMLISAIFMTLAGGAILAALYFYMIQAGLSTASSLMILAGSCGIIALVAYHIGNVFARRTSHIKDELSLFHSTPHKQGLGQTLSEIVDSFINGLAEEPVIRENKINASTVNVTSPNIEVPDDFDTTTTDTTSAYNATDSGKVTPLHETSTLAREAKKKNSAVFTRMPSDSRNIIREKYYGYE